MQIAERAEQWLNDERNGQIGHLMECPAILKDLLADNARMRAALKHCEGFNISKHTQKIIRDAIGEE